MLDVGNSTILEYQIGVYDNFDLEHQDSETFLEHVEGLIFCQHDCEQNEAINYGPDIEYT